MSFKSMQDRILADHEFQQYENAYWRFPKFYKDKGITLDDIIRHKVQTKADIDAYVKDLQGELADDKRWKLDPPVGVDGDWLDNNGY